ncbi:MAG TPA: L-threonylcarbamoyladenylate synthase [Bryobacteraceae bacterium]|nr:L-threonylcarbamoyladenylate synthase [Bryobacteraceae bacterium]
MTISLEDAAARIRAGDLVAFPTETVYGLGANALDRSAVEKIYTAKGRPPASPLIVHVSSIEMGQSLVSEWPPEAEALARRYWPGPLTLVLPKRSTVPDIVTAGLPTVGVRMPDHPLALDLIREARVPIAAPSANKFTGLSPTTAAHVRESLGDAVPVLDGGPCRVGIESTVVSISAGRITLLRPGRIALNAITETVGSTPGEIERAAAPGANAAHEAPGMHERHYSPHTPLVLTREPDPRGIYLFHTHAAKAVRVMQMPTDPEAYAARLYSALHELDREGWPVISVEPPPDTLEWAAILDRLRRAAAR